MSLFDRWQQSLEELRGLGRYRTLSVPCGIDFSSNDYLGYGSHRTGQSNVGHSCSDSLPRSGMASRLLRGHHPLWDEVEKALAGWHGAEAAIMFSSGYCANEGLLSTIAEPGDFIASDQFNHSSLIDGVRLARAERFVFPHQDLAALEAGLRRAAETQRHGQQRFVVTEALFSMDGDRAPLLEIAQLCERYQAHLIVDEAHTTGCFGATGAGLVAELDLRSQVLATVHTGGKALGVTGAYVCGARLLRDVLVNRCRQLIFTTALPAAIARWWQDAVQRVQSDRLGREALHTRAAFFRAELARLGCQAMGTDYIVPVVLGDDRTAWLAATRLQEQGYDIRAIRPPTVPAGTSRLRISIHSDHDTDLLRKTAAAVSASVARRQSKDHA